MENPLGEVEPGPRRLLGAADGATLQHGGIAGEAEEFQLKGRLHQGPGFLQGVQGVEGVEEEGEQLRRSLPLLGGGLGDLGKVGGQGQVLQVLAHRPELLQRVCLGEGGELPPLREGHLGIDQQLAGGGEFAVLSPAAPGLHGALAQVPGEDGEDLIRFLIVGLPQDDSLGG